MDVTEIIGEALAHWRNNDQDGAAEALSQVVIDPTGEIDLVWILTGAIADHYVGTDDDEVVIELPALDPTHHANLEAVLVARLTGDREGMQLLLDRLPVEQRGVLGGCLFWMAVALDALT